MLVGTKWGLGETGAVIALPGGHRKLEVDSQAVLLESPEPQRKPRTTGTWQRDPRRKSLESIGSIHLSRLLILAQSFLKEAS